METEQGVQINGCGKFERPNIKTANFMARLHKWDSNDNNNNKS